ncbi:MAG: hypothetical protein A2464_13020 [Deltaproteobacteria bacterium RIFOXYC2_FULL_48_10]|nr:MAG: hypothetical protein A2464_13020 [Deltaproteobacteria bacterium RIFOXYC2_FULL_48_10]
MRSLDHIWPFCLFVFDSRIHKIRCIHALMKPLMCFSGAAFQKKAGIAKKHMQFWQDICNLQFGIW